jgi:hypothetical protein
MTECQSCWGSITTGEGFEFTDFSYKMGKHTKRQILILHIGARSLCKQPLPCGLPASDSCFRCSLDKSLANLGQNMAKPGPWGM